ncbi:AMP-binding enzyme [Lentibacillus sediminis]|uniref:AMP-binding enzyme n=1 Tax=Lentibacillus sediminis TaxID=1940529 RepID=UPI000C1BB7B0
MVDTEMRVVNKSGTDVQPDGVEIGEIIVKGSGTPDSENTANHQVVDGWLYTGDLGTIDENGRIQVIDQKSSSTRTSPKKIEAVFYQHPAVVEVAVAVRPHKELKETTHAYIVVQDGISADEQELLEFAKEKLSASQCPQTVTFLEELPKTASGKILRMKLQEMK